ASASLMVRHGLVHGAKITAAEAIPAPLRKQPMMNAPFPDLAGEQRTEPVPPDCGATSVWSLAQQSG
ncbi:MAG: hypothetical protein V3T76_00585, partial [candidate division NC10 bacterium]